MERQIVRNKDYYISKQVVHVWYQITTLFVKGKYDFGSFVGWVN